MSSRAVVGLSGLGALAGLLLFAGCPFSTEGLPTGNAGSGGHPGTTSSSHGAGASSASSTTTSTSTSTSHSSSTGPAPVCGDGHKDPGEECDNGANNSDTGDCTTTCKNAKCGDGHVLAGTETCDEG